MIIAVHQPIIFWLCIAGRAVSAIVARHPVHAIMFLIATFLAAGGFMFHFFKLGFTCSLLIIVYIGAIAVLFLFIVMMVPVRDRAVFKPTLLRYVGITFLVLSIWGTGAAFVQQNLEKNGVSASSEFWAGLSNMIDSQAVQLFLPNLEVESLSLTDFYSSDIAIYGSELYHSFALPIMLCGRVLLFVLVAAIVLCLDE